MHAKREFIIVHYVNKILKFIQYYMLESSPHSILSEIHKILMR